MDFCMPYATCLHLPNVCVRASFLSMSVFKLQRQHHMPFDSRHTSSLCSAKVLNSCMCERLHTCTHAVSVLCQVPICSSRRAVLLVRISVTFKSLISHTPVCPSACFYVRQLIPHILINSHKGNMFSDVKT